MDLKELRTAPGMRPLSLSSEDDLLRLLGLHKGAVTPFGVMNDESRSVQVVIDSDVRSYPSVGVHPNENTVIVWLSPDELMRAIGEHGNPVRIADVPRRIAARCPLGIPMRSSVGDDGGIDYPLDLREM